MRIALHSVGALAGAALVMLAAPASAQDNTGSTAGPSGSGMSGTSSSSPSVSSDMTTPPPPASAGYGDTGMSDNGTSFRGIRIEGNVGDDRFLSQGVHRDKLGYGATVGFDGQIGQRIVVGAEGSYWRANNFTENCTGVSDGTVCQASFEEWGTAVRVGYLLSPQFLVFGKGGYVTNEQRRRFDATAESGSTSYYDHRHTDGYQFGGGVEYDMTNMRFPVYVNVQFVRSQYNDHSSRDKLMAGIGVHFK